MEGESFHTPFAAEEEEVVWCVRESGEEWAGDMTSWANEKAIVEEIADVCTQQA